MRGKVFCALVVKSDQGITPAYAGKREQRKLLHRKKQDHPRLCGEKLENTSVTFGEAGSPPPMRGKVFDIKIFKSVIRITPAYAGKSLSCRFLPSASWDHPRLCGEKPHQ